MQRTKKADQTKNAGKTAKEPETEGQTEETAQEPETEGQTEETAQEPETEGQAEEAEPDMFANLPNPCVYCGPSVKGITRQYTTYQGGIPDALRKFIQEHPGALGLIVSTEEFPAMRRRLETHGTKDAELYKAVKEKL